MLSNPLLNVIGATNVEIAPPAMKHVCPEAHRLTLKEGQCFDKLSKGGFWEMIAN